MWRYTDSTLSPHIPEGIKMDIMEALDHMYLSRQYKIIYNSCGEDANTEKAADRNSPSKFQQDKSPRSHSGSSSVRQLKQDKKYVLDSQSDKGNAYSNKSDSMFVSEATCLGGKANLTVSPKNQQQDPSQVENLKKMPGRNFRNASKPAARHKNLGDFESRTKASDGQSQKNASRLRGKEHGGPGNANKNKINWSPVSGSGSCDTRSKNDAHEKNRNVINPRVICMYRESSRQYWVMDMTDVSTYESIQKELPSMVETVASPQVGKIYGCEYLGEIYRAKVISVVPKLTVHFIDYGNVHTYENTTKCKKLSEAVEKIPCLSYLVEFDEGTPNKYFVQDLDAKYLFIKKTGRKKGNAEVVLIVKGPFGSTVKNDSRTVEQKPQKICERQNKLNEQPPALEEEPLRQLLLRQQQLSNYLKGTSPNLVQIMAHESEQNKEKNDNPNLNRKLNKRHAIDDATEKSKGTIHLLSGNLKIRSGLIVPEEFGDADSRLDRILSMNTSNMSEYDAKEGDFVLVCHTDNNDYISRVLNKFDKSYYVNLIEIDSCVQVNKVYPLPKEYNEFPNHEILLSITEWFSQDVLNKKLKYEITGKGTEGKWLCYLKNELGNIIGMGTIEKAPKTNFGEFVCLFLKSESTVQITAIGSSNTLFLRKSNEKIKRKFGKIKNILATYSPTAGNLTSPPQIHDFCCVQNDSDNVYYRGRVLNIAEETASILLVDVGVTQNTAWKTLKPLPTDLETLPSLAIEMSLACIGTDPFEEKIRKYFSCLINNQTDFVLTYEKGTDAVFLLQKEISVSVHTSVNVLRVTGFLKFEEKEPSKPPKLENPEPNSSPNQSKSSPNPRTGHSPGSSSSPSSDSSCSSKSTQNTERDCFFDSDLTSLDIKCGQRYNLVLVHLDEDEYETHGSFWMSDSDDPSFIYVNSTLAEEIDRYCNSVSEPYSPDIGNLCLAKYKGVWYRGSTIDSNIETDQFLIIFMDFGNVATLSSASIRRTKSKFVTPPIAAYSFRIIDIDRIEKDSALKAKVRKYLEGKLNECFRNVDVCDYEDDIFSVRIQEIEDLIAGTPS